MLDQETLRRWVWPFYLSILGGKYAFQKSAQDEQQFRDQVRLVLPQITPQLLATMLRGDWRAAMTGSWFAGLKQFAELQQLIGEKLLASKLCYAGQSHSFALARFANRRSVEILGDYLNLYLQRPDCQYDQEWAMAALMWIDGQHGSSHSNLFLRPGGPWNRFIEDGMPTTASWSIETFHGRFVEMMNYCDQHFCGQ